MDGKVVVWVRNEHRHWNQRMFIALCCACDRGRLPMSVPTRDPQTAISIETAVSIFVKTEARIQEVERHIENAKGLVAEIKQRLRNFELPKG